jgi:hypothetical protein
MIQLELKSDAVGFDAKNASWMCRAAEWLAGDDASVVRKTLNEEGLSRFVWFRQPEIRAFLAGDAKRIVAVFQGSNGAALLNRLAVEPQSFASTPLGRVNAYFWREFSLIRSNVLETITAMRDAQQQVWLGGHGVGGAFAVLAAGLLETELRIPVRGVITFGSPRVGHREFAVAYHQSKIGDESRLLDRTLRVVNAADPFTAVPATADDYAAIGLKRQFDEAGRFVSSSEADLAVAAGLAATAQIAAGEFDPPEIADHSLAAYLRLMRAEGNIISDRYS